VPVIINLGPAFRLIDPHRNTSELYGSFVAGLHDCPTLVETGGPSVAMQVNFTPVGARLLFGLPMAELYNRVVELDDVFGVPGRWLVAELGEAQTWETRFETLDSFLSARAQEGRPPSAIALHGWHRLKETAGGIGIGSLATEMGYSRKHVIARFREEIGLAPKTLARVLRFTRLIQLIDRNAGASWAESALEAGYYDQSHLIRDFGQFAGCTPEAYVRLRLPDDGGVIGESRPVDTG
jgi:AraC-like DNA-binding protein